MKGSKLIRHRIKDYWIRTENYSVFVRINPIHTGPFGGSSVPGGGHSPRPPLHNFWLGNARLTKLTTVEAHQVRNMLIWKKNWWRHVFGDDVITVSQNVGFLAKNHYIFKSPWNELQKSFFDSVFAQMRKSGVTFTSFRGFFQIYPISPISSARKSRKIQNRENRGKNRKIGKSSDTPFSFSI